MGRVNVTFLLQTSKLSEVSDWMEVLLEELLNWWDLSEVFHYLTYVSLLLACSQLSQSPFQNNQNKTFGAQNFSYRSTVRNDNTNNKQSSG